MQYEIDPEVFLKAAKTMNSRLFLESGMCAAVDKAIGTTPGYDTWNLYRHHARFLEAIIGPNEEHKQNKPYYGDDWGLKDGEIVFSKAQEARVIGLLFTYEFAKDYVKENSHE